MHLIIAYDVAPLFSKLMGGLSPTCTPLPTGLLQYDSRVLPKQGHIFTLYYCTSLLTKVYYRNIRDLGNLSTKVQVLEGHRKDELMFVCTFKS